jgi:hypothetical protein
MEFKSNFAAVFIIIQKIFHNFNFVTTFASFINIMVVITKAGGNRPDESLATSNFGKVLHSNASTRRYR